MNQILKIVLCLCSLFPVVLSAQIIKGKVLDNAQTPLIGANVYWSGTTTGTITDADVFFELTTSQTNSNLLVASYVGHEADTIEVNQAKDLTFTLNTPHTLSEVTISGQQDAVIISNIKAIKSEQITQTSLR